jgi:predicted transposase YbfD/YdcC
MEGFVSVFGSLPDPRAENARYDLTAVLFIALAALLCGAESCADMADFGESKKRLLQQVMRLPYGIPSHDTFSRVFRYLDAEAFETAFARFAASFAKAIEGVVAIDGKAVRGAYQRGCKTSPLHLVNVWAAEARLAIAQKRAPGRNEAKGVREALALLSLKGCIVTADALHCRVDTAQAILATGADYALTLKDNHPGLLAQVKAHIHAARDPDKAATTTQAHDRYEERTAIVVPVADIDFPGLQAVACIESLRRDSTGAETRHTRHTLLSTLLPAERVLSVVRAHWTIENQLHWMLDVILNEDAARTRKDNGPQNLATLRKIALNILRTHPEKASVRRKIKKAGWDDAFLTSLLSHMR